MISQPKLLFKSARTICLLILVTACGTTAPPTTASSASSAGESNGDRSPQATAQGDATPSTSQSVAQNGNSESAAPVDAPVPHTSPHFVTPSGKIECLAIADTLRCELATGESVNPLPLRPSDCDLDWGQGIVLSAAGDASVLCAGDTIRQGAENSFTLPYGQTWQHGDFVCSVEPIGLTCRNSSEAGFFLSTQNWRPLLPYLFEFNQTRNERFGFALTVPLPWDIQPSPNGDGFNVISPTGDLNIKAWGSRIEDYQPAIQLSELITQRRQEILAHSPATIHSDSDITVPIEGAGQAAAGWSVDYSQQGDRIIETIVLHNGLIYRLHHQMPESEFGGIYLAVIQEINTNFTILASNTES